jgi:aspartate/methionine/tyrosine aminotransferase
MQRAAISVLDWERTQQETAAIQRCFSAKRDMMLRELRKIGVKIDRVPEGTFYVWGSVEGLPGPISDGNAFFRAALEQKVIVVPGEFFDVNPGKRRAHRLSRFRQHLRFSFGPSEDTLTRAMKRLSKMVEQHRR